MVLLEILGGLPRLAVDWLAEVMSQDDFASLVEAECAAGCLPDAAVSTLLDNLLSKVGCSYARCCH